MKIWSRDFTRTEKILLAVLFILLFGYAYYLLVDAPVRKGIASAQAEAQAVEAEMSAVSAKARYLEQLQQELNEVKTRDSLSRMESYNNSNAEVAFLHDVLGSSTLDYTIEFSDITRYKDQIRRNFSVQFRTRDYNGMRAIIEKLCASRYRCLVNEIRCQMTNTEKESYVTANVTATFFETMVGGKPDAGLPEDLAEVEAGTGK
ncbi:MAG: type II secretion system protein M [Clostridium sp.]|nr:type II secretion system protein M [Clostridium sp.]